MKRWWSMAAAVGFLAGPGVATGAPEQLGLDVRLGNPVLLAGGAGESRRVYLRVALTGFERPGSARPPVNVALVIDKSGSMSGDKIRQAREAARLALDRLGGDDIVSVVAYDDGVSVLVPATKVRDRRTIERGIARLSAGGRTALFAGVVKGAEEVRKFLDRNQVNRVVLVSDGLANVGPAAPSDLARLGATLVDQGISVTTIGLGSDYNEDLMVGLARASDGNHAFAEAPSDLVRFFDLEFGALLSVVAQQVRVRVDCAQGVRPLRVLGRDAEIVGPEVVVGFNQVFAGHEKTVVVELEVPASGEGSEAHVASVEVSYGNTISRLTERVAGAVGARFTRDRAEVERQADRDVGVRVVELLSAERTGLALRLRDEGRIADAQRTIDENEAFLLENARRYRSPRLEKLQVEQQRQKKNVGKKGEAWKKERKRMRDLNFDLDTESFY